MMLTSFPTPLRALVIGSSGAIGSAFVELLSQAGAELTALHRHSEPALDFADEAGIAAAAAAVSTRGPFHLIINASGLLHTEQFMPEKKLAELSYAQLRATFEANTFGPALLMRHFSPLLDPQRGVMALLSAKVGSISDNRLGGWYSYRASKAALNMLIKTAAIELRRTAPNAVLLALHPGTVSSALSQPFRGGAGARPALVAAAEMLAVIDAKTAAQSGRFYAYDDSELAW
ncbi:MULTISPECIES: SDR family NAD(P)-dependent oxidoreductase [unclassified Undibacterium]|nr:MULTISPECIES: SDR family NAD(P)-dependent oxidoreductase [unclassified Undibacterium]MEB0139906.1 SDR family NAD(P)-dependent oxidoreductase [Undibacterium sp. CCC2.1]MEB0171825.1 SDR family NAD(P)-dependent oxidoreductase [Undibacterium sp. CCC1.1]MEB0175641.1 SDR family NAD(P)-dependent oxidoreductase [Undibacterium sp. CCC3.4]WPX44116.1 SDR family NAD(P)-dependent oxidoreductase [Undibacterium sp. CCC3.4]